MKEGFTIENKIHEIACALGKKKADFVLKNADILNVFTGELEHGDLAVTGDLIVGIGNYEGEKEIDATGKVIVPGFIDGHMHLESSIVTPKEYARAVIPHGTSAVVADPHEIANVCGTAGIDFILNSSENLPLDVFLMVPSCVPATPFDENGYSNGPKEIEKYLTHERVLGLAEFMNYPGILSCDSEVLEKILTTQKAKKIIDGHAPAINGKNLNAYVTAGVYSDHECSSADEAIEKLRRGQWIMIREGTACKNLQALTPLCTDRYFSRCLFVTDDKHPGDLISEGHIDFIIKKAIKLGVRPDIAYRIATINAATYFNLYNTGAICPGYKADFVVLNDFENVEINSVYKNGCKVFDSADPEVENQSFNKSGKADSVYEKYPDICDTVHINKITASDFHLTKPAKIIGLVSGEILTTYEGSTDKVDVENDICKLAVIERHHNTGHIGLCYLKGYNLKSGAIATSIAHDSHNIICAGTNDEDMALAVNELKNIKGGMIVVKDGKILASLSLPVAGLMCDLSVKETQTQLDFVKKQAIDLGISQGIDPFMTLSFSSLPVIPSLRLTTLGVIDVMNFKLIKD